MFGGFGTKREKKILGKLRLGRQSKIELRLERAVDGFDRFVLASPKRNEIIFIHQEIFDMFRQTVFRLGRKFREKDDAAMDVDEQLFFLNELMFSFSGENDEGWMVRITEHQGQNIKKGSIKIPLADWEAFEKFLSSPKLGADHEALSRIIEYHKIFQQTFVEGSDSINSDLQLRKDFLSQVTPYTPPRRGLADTNTAQETTTAKDYDENIEDDEDSDDSKNKKLPNTFKSRLGEKNEKIGLTIDYDNLLANHGHAIVPPSINVTNKKRKRKDRFYLLPTPASEVKQMRDFPFKCEFTIDEMQEFRDEVLSSEEMEYLLGFEVIEAIYKVNGKLMSFSFPLYYMRVSIQESNRTIMIDPTQGGIAFLNHTALATLVTQRTKNGGSNEPVDRFLQTLLAQRVTVGTEQLPIRLMRRLPVKEEFFARAREVFLGQEGENGLGGILGNLDVIGIECDTQSVHLYPMPKTSSTITEALEQDLDTIYRIAENRPKAYSKSLLGKFLSTSPNSKKRSINSKKFCDSPWIPGSVPSATRNLIDKLNTSDLVLLEGPPGTGKTYTIFNLFLHSLCTGKRLLIVSDQQAALVALIEKIEDYLFGETRGTPTGKGLSDLFRSAVRVVDGVPTSLNYSNWITKFQQMLDLENIKEVDSLVGGEKPIDTNTIDKKIAVLKDEISQIVTSQLGQGDKTGHVSHKRDHAYTRREIASLSALLEIIDREHSGLEGRVLVQQFCRDRELVIKHKLGYLLNILSVNSEVSEDSVDEIRSLQGVFRAIMKEKPRNFEALTHFTGRIDDPKIREALEEKFESYFHSGKDLTQKFKWLWSYISYPLTLEIKRIDFLVQSHKKLLKSCMKINPLAGQQWQTLHKALTDKGGAERLPVVLEIVRHNYLKQAPKTGGRSVAEILDEIDKLQSERDNVVRTKVIRSLQDIVIKATKSNSEKSVAPITSISARTNALGQHSNFGAARSDWLELQEELVGAFPIWLCRKQAVSFVFPCKEQMFDLVIVDEATQCRVDDALPLLYRAQKIMVVGDDKQTVLAKNSIVDDYLFDEFALSEHLRATHAHAMKGGGSHIFGLIKSIRQACVMLDEHYRCPPDIIQYSNKYVYGSELKTMQWLPTGAPASVVVDFSENKAQASERASSGQFKGIETKMVDRFMDYLVKEVKKLEKELGRAINVETEVAICYFLLKNDPYVKRIKPEYLRKLNRGDNILDGAGAALQGKERNFIFYLWDINRGNMLAFRQGDEPDKRKGELNVLMSRPKIRAYHFLHGKFDKLDLNKATIAEYLWNSLQGQSKKEAQVEYVPRQKRPDAGLVVWQRSSGQMLEYILANFLPLARSPIRNEKSKKGGFVAQYAVSVGNPKHVVDLVISPPANKSQGKKHVAVVDLAGFEPGTNVGEDITDYFFQLKRATPKLAPVFAFVHEICDQESYPTNKIFESLEVRRYKKDAKDDDDESGVA